jgi:hypothetical protein
MLLSSLGAMIPLHEHVVKIGAWEEEVTKQIDSQANEGLDQRCTHV